MSKLAERIAKAIMTSHGETDITVERIQMMKKRKDGSEQNCGGRNFASVVQTIDRVLGDRSST